MESRVSSPHFGCAHTPGTQSRTSLIVAAGVFLNCVSGTTATPPGVRAISAVACAVVGTVRLVACAGRAATAAAGRERGALRLMRAGFGGRTVICGSVVLDWATAESG